MSSLLDSFPAARDVPVADLSESIYFAMFLRESPTDSSKILCGGTGNERSMFQSHYYSIKLLRYSKSIILFLLQYVNILSNNQPLYRVSMAPPCYSLIAAHL